MHNDYQMMQNESDECLTKRICSVSPALSSVQEIILLYIKNFRFIF